MIEKHFYEFGPFRLDMALSRLERAGTAIPISPKAFDLLVLLARNSDRVMAKSELLETLWPNTFVEDANLTQHIYTLRKVLGDRPDAKPYIETVPRRGYRLVADVHEGRREPGPPIGPPTVLEGERKRATVLHGAIANAATVAEHLGTIEMHRLTEKLFVVVSEEVARYGGVVTEKHPDWFVAIFGAREVHEDDGRRAILAALAIDRRANSLGPSMPLPEVGIKVKTGVASGLLVINRVTDGKDVQYVAVGDSLRAADLLQQFAEPGAILIDGVTARSVDRNIQIAPEGSIGGWTAFRVAGPLSRPHAPAPAARTLAPFVGREREASLLDGLLTRVLAGSGQVVSIVGEPGLGKSRLVYESTRRMTAHGDGVQILEGRCLSYGSLIPYLPLIDLLRAHCEISDTDMPDAVQRSIENAVRQNGLASDAGAWLLRLIGIVDQATALDTLSPEAVKARTFDALRLLFLKAAARTPLVLVIEDIHWIDRTSEEFLTTLVGQLIAANILLIATHRPGYRPPWMDRSYVTQITIAPLDAGDSARLLESVAGGQSVEPDASAAILRRGEGNPFFLEELARAVLEQGADASSIPETVQGVIMARMDRLPDEPKRLLQTASVIGREVPERVLARVWEHARDLSSAIEELCRQEFLYERAGGDDRVYVFKHALTQDVAYDSLLARRRRDLHLTTARALEELHAARLDEHAATLAYHYARTDVIEDAVEWLIRAADQAARVYANAEAVLHLDLAARRLQRLPEGPPRDRRMLDVALRQAHSLYFLGRFRDSVDILLPHGARLVRLGDPALSASYAFWLGHMYSRLGDQRRAADSAKRAIEAATRADDHATLGKAHGVLALEGHWSGQTSEGIEHGQESVHQLLPLPSQRWWLGMTYFYLAINHLLTGDFEAALAEAARANAVGAEIGDPRLQTYAGYASGWIESTRGNTAAAIAACRASLERAPDRVSRAYASLFLCFALLDPGSSSVEHDEARQRLQGTLTELEGFAFPQWHALAAMLMGEAERLHGCLDEAERWTTKGIEIASRVNYHYARDLGERITGRIAESRARLLNKA